MLQSIDRPLLIFVTVPWHEGQALSCRYLDFHGQLYYFLTGLDDLVMQLDRTMLKVTGRRSLVVRVRMGGEEVR